MNTIPPITSEQGRGWRQPSTTHIDFDGDYALMPQWVFKELSEYSRSMPSGVYDGKMWKAQMKDGTWLLRWYEPCDEPSKCACPSKILLVVDEVVTL